MPLAFETVISFECIDLKMSQESLKHKVVTFLDVKVIGSVFRHPLLFTLIPVSLFNHLFAHLFLKSASSRLSFPLSSPAAIDRVLCELERI